jgi:HlyD family secretion protein
MPSRKCFTLPAALSLAALAAACSGGYSDRTAPIVGMSRRTELRIAPETGGRLSLLAVHPGQIVHKGELLATIDNPDLEARLGEARAAAASVKAERDRVFRGPRDEQVAIAGQALETAEANLKLAQDQNNRTAALAAKDFASIQLRDERNAGLARAQADVKLKAAEYAAAKAGPTAETRALAQAKVALAEATLADLEAQVAKLRLFAPADGRVAVQAAETGEVMQPGKPVLTMEAEHEGWLGFTLREDRLNGLRVGDVLTVTGADGRRFKARVTGLRPLGEFATWRAARAVGDHDLNSFRLRLEPVDKAEKLEPGQSFWIMES